MMHNIIPPLNCFHPQCYSIVGHCSGGCLPFSLGNSNRGRRYFQFKAVDRFFITIGLEETPTTQGTCKDVQLVAVSFTSLLLKSLVSYRVSSKPEHKWTILSPLIGVAFSRACHDIKSINQHTHLQIVIYCIAEY